MFLLTGKLDDAKRMLKFFSKYANSNGIIPDAILDLGGALYSDPSVSLWFIEALNNYINYAKSENLIEPAFIKNMIPVIDKILNCYIKGNDEFFMDKDGLINIVSNGKTLEMQALFYNSLSIACNLHEMLGSKEKADYYKKLKLNTEKSINEEFFKNGKFYPYTSIKGSKYYEEIGADALLLISLSMNENLLSETKKSDIIFTLRKDLLTQYGLRNKSLIDSGLVSENQDQGTIKPIYTAYYLRALERIDTKESASDFIKHITALANNMIYAINKNNTLPQFFEGKAPYRTQGDFSYSVSIAGFLEVLNILNNYQKDMEINENIRYNINLEANKRILSAT